MKDVGREARTGGMSKEMEDECGNDSRASSILHEM
jgi:hypothetical protein